MGNSTDTNKNQRFIDLMYTIEPASKGTVGGQIGYLIIIFLHEQFLAEFRDKIYLKSNYRLNKTSFFFHFEIFKIPYIFH